jgi:hypothetical protein
MIEGWNQNIDSNQKAECPSLALFCRVIVILPIRRDITVSSMKK